MACVLILNIGYTRSATRPRARRHRFSRSHRFSWPRFSLVSGRSVSLSVCPSCRLSARATIYRSTISQPVGPIGASEASRAPRAGTRRQGRPGDGKGHDTTRHVVVVYTSDDCVACAVRCTRNTTVVLVYFTVDHGDTSACDCTTKIDTEAKVGIEPRDRR